MAWTVGEHLARGDTLTAYCGNHLCLRNVKRSKIPPGVLPPPHGITLDLSKLDPSLTPDDLRARLKCTSCGERQASIRLNPNAAGMGPKDGRPG